MRILVIGSGGQEDRPVEPPGMSGTSRSTTLNLIESLHKQNIEATIKKALNESYRPENPDTRLEVICILRHGGNEIQTGKIFSIPNPDWSPEKAEKALEILSGPNPNWDKCPKCGKNVLTVKHTEEGGYIELRCTNCDYISEKRRTGNISICPACGAILDGSGDFSIMDVSCKHCDYKDRFYS